MSYVQNPAKVALRKAIQAKLACISRDAQMEQSNRVTAKLFDMEAYKSASSVSIYLSTDGELSTVEILKKMFKESKQVFVPTYKGSVMEMVQLCGMDDYENLPVTKWNIKQPNVTDGRANALENDGLDLVLLPGVAFTTDGGRCGHGRGYYDSYLERYFELFPERIGKNMSIDEKVKNKKTVLIGLALKEQIVTKEDLPLDPHDVILDLVLYAK